jgi:hypothetical protein
MLKDLEEKITKEIENRKIKPVGRSVFIFKKTLVWFLIFFLLLMAGLSLSVLFSLIIHGDWDIYRFLSMPKGLFFLKAFPYFWLLAVLIFLLLAIFRTKRADGVYSHPFVYHGLAGLALISVFAFIFYFSGLGSLAESSLSESDVYRRMNYFRSSWDNPDNGLLAGVLESSGAGLLLKDFSNQTWVIDSPEGDFSGKTLLSPGRKVKLVGRIVSPRRFYVEEARPWECGCRHCAGKETSCSGCASGNCSNKASSCASE